VAGVTVGTSIWSRNLETLHAAFTVPGWKLFTSFMLGWILCVGRRTITGIHGAAYHESRPHDALHRFIRCGTWDGLVLSELLTKKIVDALVPTGQVLEFDLDDTLLHKSGPKVNGADFWRDAVRSTGNRTVIARGLNVLVVTLRIRPPWGGEPLGLPALILLHRKGENKLTDLAAQAVKTLTSWFPGRRIRWCADGAYASPLLPLHQPQSTFISRMRRDAALYELVPERTGKCGRPRTKGARIGTPLQIAREAERWEEVATEERGRIRTRLVHSRIVLWYAVSKAPVRLVISRDPEGREHDDFWVCSDLDLPPQTVISSYAGRWSIEDTFRACKQNLGIQHPQSWVGNGPERVATLGFLLYSLVWWWFLSLPPENQRVRATPWFPSKTNPSFLDALAALRRELWRSRIYETSGSGAISHEIGEAMLEALARAG
jgi:hypothetical protein